MSVLSPIALAILGNLKALGKDESAANEGAFLSLLDSNSEFGFSSDTEKHQALVDVLYEKDPLPQAVQSAPQQAESNTSRKSEDNVADKGQEKNAVPVKDTAADNARDNKPSNASDKKAENDNKPATADKTAPEEKEAVDAVAKNKTNDSEVGYQEAIVPLAEKIRGKIDELSNLLSSIASLLGVNPQAQVSVAQVSITTLTISQQGLQVNKPFVDLSDRFQQLIAAISASQQLPADASQSFGVTIQSFQSLFFSDAVVAGEGTFNPDTLTAQCKLCAYNLSYTVQSLQQVAGEQEVVGQLGEEFQKLQAWLNDFQSLTSPRQFTGQQHVLYEAFKLAQLPNQATPSMDNADILDAIPSVPVSGNNMAQQITQGQSQAVAAAAMVENAAGNSANFSQGQQGSGQGGERPATSGITTALGAGSTAGAQNASAANFDKALKQAARMPMAEQVVFHIKTAVKEGSSRIHIQLDPVELGKLSIKLELSGDGKASGVVITADHKATLDLLQRDARGLEAALADAGIQADSGSLSFNLRGGDQGQEEKNTFAGYPIVPEEELDDLTPLSVLSQSYVVEVSDGLDIKI